MEMFFWISAVFLLIVSDNERNSIRENVSFPHVLNFPEFSTISCGKSLFYSDFCFTSQILHTVSKNERIPIRGNVSFPNCVEFSTVSLYVIFEFLLYFDM